MTEDTAFQLLMKPITANLITECVNRYRSDYDCVNFNTLNHLQTMVFAHINEIKSLRTLEVAFNNHPLNSHFKVARSTLSDANHKRPVNCFSWILEQLMLFLPRTMRKDINKAVKLLDSTPIKLKGLGYDEWAKSYATAHWQGLKLHVEFDLEIKSPTKIAMSYANLNDSSMGQKWPILPDTVYVFDKGYCDYNWWWDIHQRGAYFVTRLKNNAAILMKSEEITTGDSVLEDGFFRFKNKHPRGRKKNLYAAPLRRIAIKREGKSPLILVTNLLNVSAETIAALYKARWDIELFFKWIKQNLRIKKFLGRSANAVQIQIVTALIAYVLVFLFKTNSRDQRSLQLLLVWLRFNLASICHESALNHDPPICYGLIAKKEDVYL